MKRSTILVGLTATTLVLPLGAMTAAATEDAPVDATAWTEWISDDGGSAGREQPAISADGRYVVFVGRSDAFGGVWVKDRSKPLTPPVQVASGFLFNPDISADGSTVTWSQYGSGSSGGQQVYIKKWQVPGASAVLASLGDDDQPANGVTDFPSLSGDGRYVAFQSMDLTLDEQASAGEGGNRTKAYVRDMVAGTTDMVSLTDDEQVPNGSGIKPDITPDGRYVAFASDSSDLQAIASEGEETTVYQQVYRRDRVEGTTVPVSVSSAGVFGDGSSSTSTGPSISDDGLQVAFESTAANLVGGDTNDDTDVFVRRVGAAVTVRISLDENGDQVDTDDTNDVAAGAVPDDPATNEDESKAVDALPVGTNPAVNGTGGIVAFTSYGALMAEDVNDVSDIYRFGLADSALPDLTRSSVVDDPADPLAFEASGTRVDGESGETVPASNGTDPTLSADGTRVAFVSQGNLTGRIVEEEGVDGEAAEVTAIEPNIYLRRPNPEPAFATPPATPTATPTTTPTVPPVVTPTPDTTAPRSKAFSRKVVRGARIKVRYTWSDPGIPSSGVVAVRLYVKEPSDRRFHLRKVDRTGALDGRFRVGARATGTYRFYTVAKDAQGNLEKRPWKADSITVRR